MKANSTHIVWLAVLISLGPMLHGLMALASPDVIVANRGPIDPVLVATILAIWALALGAGFRDRDFSPGFQLADRIAISVLAVIAMATTLFVAPSTSFSALMLLMLISAILTGLAIRFLLGTVPESAGRYVAFALLMTMIFFLPALFILLNHPPVDGDMIRAIPGYRNVRRWGFILAAAISVGTGLLALPDLRPAGRIGLMAALVVLWIAICWSGTRGGILAVIGSVGISVALAPKVLRTALLPASLTMAAGALISLTLPNPSADFGLWNAAARAVSQPGTDQFPFSRISIWLNALEAIRQRPLFGHGYAQNIWVNANPVPYTHSHNVILEVLMAWGLIGGGLAIYLGLRLWLSGAKLVYRTQNPLRVAALTLVTCMGLFGLVDGSLFFLDSLFLTAVAAGILFARHPSLPAQPVPDTQPPS